MDALEHGRTLRAIADVGRSEEAHRRAAERKTAPSAGPACEAGGLPSALY